jgi:hypothetical protein
VNIVLEDLKIFRLEAQMIEIKLRVVNIKNTQNDLLSVKYRDDRNAQVDLFTVQKDLDAAVLGLALFGDVEIGEDLNAGGQTMTQFAGHLDDAL